jgi:Tfp pilus assembly protein PilV
MKKPLCSTRKQSGFVLPIVLFSIVIIMIAISTQIYIYRHELQITANYLEQVKMETLFQMSLTQVKQDLDSLDTFPAHLSYEYQDGSVTVYIPAESHLQLTFHIHTDDHNAKTVINYSL